MNKYNINIHDEIINDNLDDIGDLRVPISNDEDYFFQLKYIIKSESIKVENLYISGSYIRFKLSYSEVNQITKKNLTIKQHLIERINTIKNISNLIPTEAYHSINNDGMLIEIFRKIDKVC